MINLTIIQLGTVLKKFLTLEVFFLEKKIFSNNIIQV